MSHDKKLRGATPIRLRARARVRAVPMLLAALAVSSIVPGLAGGCVDPACQSYADKVNACCDRFCSSLEILGDGSCHSELLNGGVAIECCTGTCSCDFDPSDAKDCESVVGLLGCPHGQGTRGLYYKCE